ncbi:MAG: RNA-binding transcriptional accessory protein [Spirochaetales bacterium]|nr:RNA-binding transcriptional accessory protein [Spirochaetales bacterium]
MQNLEQTLAQTTGFTESQITAVLNLFSEGATVPFIARYRKEATGGMSETDIITLRDTADKITALEKRREAVLKSLQDQEKLTPALEKSVRAAESLAVLEDLYLPYRPKRKTRGSVARERGLQGLAELLRLAESRLQPETEAGRFLNPEKGVHTPEDALAGARDILAEEINESTPVRSAVRDLFFRRGVLSSKVIKAKAEEGKTYRDYFAYSQPAEKAPSHRVLAVLRGQKEGFLTVHAQPEEEEALRLLTRLVFPPGGGGAAGEQLRLSIADGYKRLLAPSLEHELLTSLKERADEDALTVFASNLREILLAAPLGEKSVLAVDPGQRTGCKITCLDAQGKLVEKGIIYLFQGEKARKEAAEILTSLVEKHAIQALAVGNGTGGRETMDFLRAIDLPGNPIITLVNESGASVYSASETARREFPDLDLTYRGAVSIGRRLQDPLAELVKIDPKSIGVGQYQHDVDQKKLKAALDDVVISCVNAVGVDVNQASVELLRYVSGLTEKLAHQIVARREERGRYARREVLKDLPGLGEKTFEQAAGFLRIRGGDNPLDESAVHPERYELVECMARDAGTTTVELMKQPQLVDKLDPRRYVSHEVGLPTIRDILAELKKPGRDPRTDFQVFHYTEGIDEIGKLKAGMRLPGVVTNVTAFGAFVDLGVHQDGLVHISKMSKSFVRDPSTIARPGMKVQVTVLEVDQDRKRISLSMVEDAEPGRE